MRQREVGCVYKRGRLWWLKYPVEGYEQPIYESSGTADKREAESLLAQRRRELRAGTWKHPNEQTASRRVDAARRELAAALEAAPESVNEPAPLTVTDYLDAWIERRRAAGVITVRNEVLFFDTHVKPAIGELALVAVTRVHVRELVAKVSAHVSTKTGERLSSRTVLHVYRTLATAMKDAVDDGLIRATPCTLRTRKGELPRKRDKDPKRRKAAVYQREDVEILISDPRIPADRRALYALQLLGGMRAMEAAGRRWEDYDTTARPLGRLTVATQADGAEDDRETKTGEIREVPVHPTLARVLESWRREGFPLLFGRAPRPEDPIVPSRNDFRGRSFRTRAAMYDRLLDDVNRLELRRVPWMQHAMRATFLSLLELDGANMGIARRATHAAPTDVVGGYIRVGWADVCREIERLQVGGNVVAIGSLKVAASDSGGDNLPGIVGNRPVLMGVAGLERPRRRGTARDSRDRSDTGPSAGALTPSTDPGNRAPEAQSVTQSVTALADRLARLDPTKLAALLEALEREGRS